MLNEIRRQFPIFENNPDLIYLDSGATSQKPRTVMDAIKEFYEKHNANIHRGIYSLSIRSTEIYEKSKEKVAHFINARSPREIVYTKNATEALNLVMYSLMDRVKEGDEIVITISEHHANLVPWQQLAKRKNAVLKYIDVDDEGRLNLKDAKEKITRKTKIVALNHVSNVTGVIHPVEEVIEMARGVRAITIVDACQSAPHIPVDVQRMGANFLAFSAHKMLGPTGIGVLWGREELLKEIDPFLFGGDMIERVDLYESTWNDIPMKFEAGTPPIAEAAGLSAAIDFLSEIGMGNVFQHEREIVDYLLDKLLSMDHITLYGPKDNSDRIAIFTFNVKGLHAHDVAHFFDYKNIAVRSGHHCAQPLLRRLGAENLSTVRASFYIYNDSSDADALVEALKEVKRYAESI